MEDTKGIADMPDLGALSREELLELDQRIDQELETRAFEDRLKREVEYHMRKRERDQQGNGRQGR